MSTPPTPATNPEAELAFRYVTETDEHIFLTGRAGTGKTTFLHRIRRECGKQLAVVAPTGVAAINAKGVTIHSQFQLPFGTLTPDRRSSELAKRRLGKDKARVLRGIDLLVIDEVSMVRADVMDALDERLRRTRDPSRPFGGVQLLMIGDLHQLPPVVKNDEEYLLREHYDTPYFFSSGALRQAGVTAIELKHIYRQTDAQFIHLLNEVRENRMTDDVLAALNARHAPDAGALAPGVITLTSHRRTADDHNAERLAELTSAAHVFEAEVTGRFPPSSYPTDASLELKTGAQVMFVKNDPPPERQYFNGRIGTVVAFDKDGKTVQVECEDNGERLWVGRVLWENMDYQVDARTKEVNEEAIGGFRQLPLRLAWAITIHKSQGLTFDRVAIDAAAAFAHGQVYVALSRCRSLEGISLLTEISTSSVRTDAKVEAHAAEREDPSEASLAASRVRYRRRALLDVFDYERLGRDLIALLRYYVEQGTRLVAADPERLEALVGQFERETLHHARGWRRVLAKAQQQHDYESELVPVDERTRKAAAHFQDALSGLRQNLRTLGYGSDNEDVRRRLNNLCADLDRGLRVALAQLAVATEDFAPEKLVRTRATASLEEMPTGDGGAVATGRTADGAPVPGALRKVVDVDIYKRLYAWRKTAATEAGITNPAQVIPTKTLIAIANEKPATVKALGQVAGMGKRRLSRYGVAIVGVLSRGDEPADASSGRTASIW